MRHFQIFLVAAVAVASVLVPSADSVRSTPVPPVFFSVEGIGPAHDVGPGCTSADMLGPFPTIITACPARAAPAPAGPVPGVGTAAPANLGLNMGAPFTDDLDAFSWGDAVGAAASDYDFSVDPAPANGGVTVGAPVLPACAAFVPNATSEATALEAQGDFFTTAGPPMGCNVQTPTGCTIGFGMPCDEAALGLIAPNAGAPGVPPLDNVDAMAEWPGIPGPCTLAAGATTCGAFSVAAGSAVLAPGVAPPDGLTGLAVNEATILVQPGTPANPPNLPVGCPGGGPACGAVHSTTLGLLGAGVNDIDALCWFDMDGDFVPDPPAQVFLGGDLYIFSLTPASAFVGAGLFSAADLLTAGVPVPKVVAASNRLGLLPTDDVDALTCHQADGDSDGTLDAFDTENDADLDGYTDVMESESALCRNAVNEDVFDDAMVNDGCAAFAGAAEVACADALDSDGDGRVNDGCPVIGASGEGVYEIGTSARGPCGVGAAPAPSPSWPSDFVSGGIPESTDAVTITDLTSFLAPAPRKFGTTPPAAAYSSRWDLMPGPGLLASWINIVDLASLLAGPSGFPAMAPYFGARAFGSALDCTGP